MKQIIDEYTNQDITPTKKWKLRHPEQAKKSEYDRKQRYIKKDPLRNLLKQVKCRAKKKNFDFNLTKSDFENKMPKVCPVLGVPLERNSEKGWWPYSPSIDRIDNDKGYISGNVRIISWRANSLKSDATIEEMEKILAYMKKEYVARAV